MVDISIIVVSFNTCDITKQALDAIQMSLGKSPKLSYEIFVIDNNSEDGSQEMLQKYSSAPHHGSIHTIFNKENTGFGAANNQGISMAQGEYILLLNSDLIADNVDFAHLLDYMNSDKTIGALTPRVELSDGSIDPASHRGFPTVWRSITYLTKLERLTQHIPVVNRLFGGYHLTYLNLNTIHDIDSPTAAFMIIRTSVLDEVGMFDEHFFMYGEDLDLAFRIRKAGYRIVYYPSMTVLHLKHQSGLKNKHKKTQIDTKFHFHDAMKIFYDKHYAHKRPKFVNTLVHKAVDLKYRLQKSHI